jgi:hypothetical protein
MDWSYSFNDVVQAVPDANASKLKRKDPVFLHDDPQDSSTFYLSGYY